MNIADASRLWRKGYSTHQIASELKVKEAAVWNALNAIKAVAHMTAWRKAG